MDTSFLWNVSKCENRKKIQNDSTTTAIFRQSQCADCYTPKRGSLRPDLESRNDQSKSRKLLCNKCKQLFDFNPSGHITQVIREEHLSRQRPVICYTCHDQRPTYNCSRCGETGHREDFQMTNFDRDCKRGAQQCLECKSGRRIGKVCMMKQCQKFVHRENLSQVHQESKTRMFVCETCTEKGYTTANTHTYTCASCKEVTGGHGLFQTPNFRRAV